MTHLDKLGRLYKTELFENILPFWPTHSQDLAYVGYFTCLDRQGKHQLPPETYSTMNRDIIF